MRTGFIDKLRLDAGRETNRPPPPSKIHPKLKFSIRVRNRARTFF